MTPDTKHVVFTVKKTLSDKVSMLSASFAASISGESGLNDEVASQVSQQKLPLPPIIKPPSKQPSEREHAVGYEMVRMFIMLRYTMELWNATLGCVHLHSANFM